MDTEKRVKAAKINMLLNLPFYGSLAADTPIIEDHSVPTLASDGMNIYYNPEYVDILHKRELVFAYGHEILHTAFEHMTRLKGRDRPVWNIATDLAINPILVTDKVGTMPKGALYDDKYLDWSAERIYADIYQELSKVGYMGDGVFSDSQSDGQQDSQSNGQSGGQQDGDNAGGSGDEESNDQQDGNGQSDQSDGDQGKEEDKIQKYRKLIERASKMFGFDPKALADAMTHNHNKGQPVDKRKIAERIIRASQAVKLRGLESAAANVLMDAIEEPKIAWQTILSQFIINQKERTSYRRINRKYQAQDIILPTKHSEVLKAVICLDVSGSIGDDELRDFFAETTSILNYNVDNKEIRLMQVDTQILDDKIWSPEMTDKDIYTRHGYGGTDFHCVFNKLDEEQNADVVIFFTDGYTSIPQQEPLSYKTIWISTGMELPWGVNIKY